MNQLFTRTDGRGFWEYLRGQGIPYRKDDFPFLSADDHPHILPVLDFSALLSMQSYAEVIGYLYQKLGKSLSYIGPILDSEFTYGFHDHSDKHALWVALQARELLVRSGKRFDGTGVCDEVSEVLAILAGMLHDIGQLVDRKQHSNYSLQLIDQLMIRDQHIYEQEWHALVDSIRLHEEPVLVSLGLSLEQMFPLHWALVVADKLHNGRDRLSQKSVGLDPEKEPFMHDKFLLADSMIARSSWHLEPETFVYQVDFSLTEFSARFEKYLGDKDRLWVPDSVYALFAKQGKPYRDSFVELFQTMYLDRMQIAAKGIFLLMPWIHSFDVRMVDNDTRDKVGSEMTILLREAR